MSCDTPQVFRLPRHEWTDVMDGYTLLTRDGYALVYAVAALVLAVSAVGTVLGLFDFGSPIWWAAFALLVVVVFLEAHGVYTRRTA